MYKSLAMQGPEYWAFQALQCIPDHVFVQDLEGRILIANCSMANSYGHSTSDILSGKMVSDLFLAETVAAMREMDKQVIKTGKAELDQEQTILESSGRRRWVKASRIPIYDTFGKIVSIVCTARDITVSKESEQLLFEQAKLLDMIAQSTPLTEILSTIVSVVENHLPAMVGAIQLLDPKRRLLMKPTAPSLPKEVIATLEQEESNFIACTMMSAIEAGESIIVSDMSGDPRFKHSSFSSKFGFRAFWCMPILSFDGETLGALSLFSASIATPNTIHLDLITMVSHMVSSAVERQETEERNKFLASHDTLTGLPNRMMFENSLVDTLEMAKDLQCRIGLAFFDLDGFKLINDTFGHAAGDVLLKTVAERAVRAIRSGDVVARLGGDEFVIILRSLSRHAEINEQRFQQVRELISAPISINGRNVKVTCSMGVAYFPDHAQNLSALIASADIAMYRAKRSGRDNIKIFDLGMIDFPDERLLLRSSFDDALARSEIVLHFQPQVNIKNKRICAAESSVHWNHPVLGLLYPNDFESIVKEAELIVALGDWILNEACQQNKKWQEAGLPKIVISVSLLSLQFQDETLVARVSAALATSGLEPEFLELEIAENLIGQDGALSKMRELAALGIKLTIANFGIGCSNFNALKHGSVSRIKMDQSFTRDILNAEKDRSIAGAIIAACHKLQLKVVAAGVENSAQTSLLNALGCHDIQGSYFSGPVGHDDFASFLVDDDIFLSRIAPLSGVLLMPDRAA